MTIKFSARDIHTERTDSHILAGFADCSENVHQFIVVMNVLRADNEIPDEMVGQPYFEYLDDTQSGYGCIDLVTLRSDRVVFKIDTDKCPEIPDKEFIAVLDVDRPRLMEIADYLSEVLNDPAKLKIIGD